MLRRPGELLVTRRGEGCSSTAVKLLAIATAAVGSNHAGPGSAAVAIANNLAVPRALRATGPEVNAADTNRNGPHARACGPFALQRRAELAPSVGAFLPSPLAGEGGERRPRSGQVRRVR